MDTTAQMDISDDSDLYIPIPDEPKYHSDDHRDLQEIRKERAIYQTNIVHTMMQNKPDSTDENAEKNHKEELSDKTEAARQSQQ
eukprot:499465-Amphidinium_carterae.2